MVFLQETHWGFDGDWTQGKWHFCNSAAERRRAGGVLVALRADVFPKEQIRWQTVEPGRLLHVRCFAEKQHLDLICFYQHALPFGVEQQKEVMTKRQNVWKKLDALLGSQPTKSSVMLAGDFNCVLPAMAPCIGVGIHNGPSAAHLVEERSKVASILRKHDLCVLNSWGRKHWTYTHPRGQSQIDYIAVRRCLADGKAKQATVQRTPLAGWRSSGHMPVQADIKLDWRPWKNSRAKPVLAPIVAKQAQNPDLHSLKQELLARRNPVAPPQRPALANVDGPVKTFWRCHAELARAKAQAPPSRLTFALIFERLRLHSRMQAAHKALKRASRARKRQQQLDILQIAEHAARCGNSKELFQCVRWLAPRQHKQSIRLRDKHGNLMSPGQECAELAEHAEALFRGVPFQQSPQEPLPEEMFSQERWANALRKIQANKAVPVAEPPGLSPLEGGLGRHGASTVWHFEGQSLLSVASSPSRMVNGSVSVAPQADENPIMP